MEMVPMPVKPLLCQNCGATVSLQENMCKCCGAKYAVETGRIIMNQLDIKKIGHSEKLMRNNLPVKVLETLAPYPEERIIFEQDWTNLKRHFLVTNKKMIFYQEDMKDYWVLPFGDFGGSSIGKVRNSMTELSGVPFFVTVQLLDSKNNVWLKLPGIFPHGTGFSTLKNAIDNAHNLWLTKK